MALRATGAPRESRGTRGWENPGLANAKAEHFSDHETPGL